MLRAQGPGAGGSPGILGVLGFWAWVLSPPSPAAALGCGGGRGAESPRAQAPAGSQAPVSLARARSTSSACASSGPSLATLGLPLPATEGAQAWVLHSSQLPCLPPPPLSRGAKPAVEGQWDWRGHGFAKALA